jgi:cell division septation protein DedD
MGKGVAWCAGVLSFSVFISACSQTTPTVPTPRFIAWSQADRTTTKRVCVLPFADKVKVPGLASQIRQSFAGHLSIKHFADTELHEIDSRLETLGPQWHSTSAQELGRILGCNALIYGEVTRASRLYLALYSQLTLESNILLVDAKTGQTLVKDGYATKFRSAGLPLSPLSFVPDAVRTLTNLSDMQMVRAVDDLGRNLAGKVPDLPALPTYQSATAPSAPPDADDLPTPRNPASALAAEREHLPPARTVAQLNSSTFDVPPTSGTVTAKDTPAVTVNTGTAMSTNGTPGEGYRLQVAALRTSTDAQKVVRLLRTKGYQPIVAQSVDTKPIWHRVVLGPFPTIHSAQIVGAQIHKVLPFSPVVINQPRP